MIFLSANFQLKQVVSQNLFMGSLYIHKLNLCIRKVYWLSRLETSLYIKSDAIDMM